MRDASQLTQDKSHGIVHKSTCSKPHEGSKPWPALPRKQAYNSSAWHCFRDFWLMSVPRYN